MAYMIHDRDTCFLMDLSAYGLRPVKTSVKSPNINAPDAIGVNAPDAIGVNAPRCDRGKCPRCDRGECNRRTVCEECQERPGLVYYRRRAAVKETVGRTCLLL